MTDALDDILKRGLEAERLFQHPLLVEAFNLVAADLTNQWAATLPEAAAERERLYQRLQTVADVRERLRVVAASGAVARAEIDRRGRLAKARDKVRDAFRDGL